MKKIIFIILLLSVYAFSQGRLVRSVEFNDSLDNIKTSVTLKANKQAKIVYVADYGTDEAAIQEAIDSAGTNGVVIFEPNRTYIQENGISISGSRYFSGLQFRGNNATLKRGNQQVTTLSAGIDQNTTVLQVDSVPSGWKVGDYLQVYHDSAYTTSNNNDGMKISEINGLNITLNKAVGLSGAYAVITWAAGDKVRKIYAQLSNTIDGTQGFSLDIENLNFDGNRDNNSGNYYFAVNEAIWIAGQNTITNCNFYEMPNENIFGNGFHIDKCYAYNLNGSFVHTTGFVAYTIDNFYGSISNCLTDSTNQVSSSLLNGHSESLITNSATAGRINVHNNYFFNGGEAVTPASYYYTLPGGASRDYIFTDNFCSGFPRITATQWRNTYEPLIPGNWVISNNVFRDCGTNDWTDYTLSVVNYDSIAIFGNQLWGNTTWTNLPLYTNKVQAFTTGDIETGDISSNDITSTGLTVTDGNVLIYDRSVLGAELYDYANAVSDTSGSEANDDLEWYVSNGSPTLSVESTDVQTGTYSLSIVATGDGDVEGIVDTLVLSAGQNYRISLWAKATTSDSISQQLTAWYNSDETLIDGAPSGVYVDTVWTQYVYYIQPTTDSVTIRVFVSTYGTVYGGTIGDELLIDNLSIQKVQGGNIIARGNFGYGNYYFENPTPTNGYVLKTDGNGVATWQPDISTSGAGLFNPDGITIDTTAGGLARIVPAIKSRIDSVWYKQPLEATLTDIADGTIAENLVNTANPWADNEVANNLTVDDAGIASTIARDSEVETLLLAFSDTLSISWGVLDTTYTGSLSGWKVPNDITITEISAYTDANTVTFNLEERAETTPNSAGTDVIGSDLVADTNQEETSTFTNATIAKNSWLVPTISATGDVSIFTISVRYIKTD
jgi:hypothetical protein